MKILIPLVLLGLGAASLALLRSEAQTKRVPPRRPGHSGRITAFDASDAAIRRGDDAEALARLRTIQSSRKWLLVDDATLRIASVLRRSGHPREAVAEYERVLTDRSLGDSDSRVDDGSVHARIAAIALDLGDEALLERTCDDLARRMAERSVGIQREIVDRRARQPGARGLASARRFEAQTREMAEQARTPPLLIMARNLEGHYDVRHVDPLYARALRDCRDPRLLYEYARVLGDDGERRAALRIFRHIPTPYPKDLGISIDGNLYRLSEYVKATPNKTEAEEHAGALRWSAKFQHDL